MLGPFRTGDLIIITVIAVVICVIAFVAKGLLALPFAIAGWILLIALVVVAWPIFLFGLTIVRYWFGAPEGFMIMTSRATGVPLLLDLELGSNNADLVLGEKESPKAMVFKDDESGTKVDPAMLSNACSPIRLPKGLDLYLYGYFDFMPQNPTQSAAYKAIEQYFHSDKCKDLHFLTTVEFIELISDPEHYLEHNALMKLNKYFKVAPKMTVVDGVAVPATVIENGKAVPVSTYVRRFTDDATGKMYDQDMDVPTMLQKIAESRNDIASLPCYIGPIAGTEAFVNNLYPYSAQHLSHVLMLNDEINKMENENKEKILLYALAVVMVCIGGGLGMYIASLAGGA